MLTVIIIMACLLFSKADGQACDDCCTPNTEKYSPCFGECLSDCLNQPPPFVIITEPHDKTEAEVACTAIGRKLVSIQTDEKLQKVVDFLSSITVDYPSLWMSLVLKNGTWQWSDGSTTIPVDLSFTIRDTFISNCASIWWNNIKWKMGETRCLTRICPFCE